MTIAALGTSFAHFATLRILSFYQYLEMLCVLPFHNMFDLGNIRMVQCSIDMLPFTNDDLA
jgi:hypothetical protein